MTATAQYVVLLVVAIALTFLVGRLLVTAGEPFLQEVFQDKAVTRSVNLLLSVLFHLITLGVLAIVLVLDIFGSAATVPGLVAKLGVVLLILGVAYGISMLVLIRVRERRRADQISEHVQERMAERGQGMIPDRGAGTTPGLGAPPSPPTTGQQPTTTRPLTPGQP